MLNLVECLLHVLLVRELAAPLHAAPAPSFLCNFCGHRPAPRFAVNTPAPHRIGLTAWGQWSGSCGSCGSIAAEHCAFRWEGEEGESLRGGRHELQLRGEDCCLTTNTHSHGRRHNNRTESVCACSAQMWKRGGRPTRAELCQQRAEGWRGSPVACCGCDGRPLLHTTGAAGRSAPAQQRCCGGGRCSQPLRGRERNIGCKGPGRARPREEERGVVRAREENLCVWPSTTDRRRGHTHTHTDADAKRKTHVCQWCDCQLECA
jgi:hypothetical protein